MKYNVDTEPSSIKSYVLFSYPNGGVKEPLLGIISISFALLLAGLITFILYVLATPFSAVTTTLNSFSFDFKFTYIIFEYFRIKYATKSSLVLSYSNTYM